MMKERKQAYLDKETVIYGDRESILDLEKHVLMKEEVKVAKRRGETTLTPKKRYTDAIMKNNSL